MILDDGLLSLMLDAVQQSQRNPSAVIAFIITWIGNRISIDDRLDSSTKHLSVILDLTTLSEQAYIAIMEKVADTLKSIGRPLTYADKEVAWIKDAVLILMSSSLFPLSESGYSAFVMCMNEDRVYSPAGSILGHYLLRSIKEHLPLERLHNSLLLILDLFPLQKTTAMPLWQIYNTLLGEQVVGKPILVETIQNNSNCTEDPEVCKILHYIWLSVLAVVNKSINSEISIMAGLEKAICIGLSLENILKKDGVFLSLYMCWYTDYNSFRALALYGSLHKRNRLPDEQIS